MPSFRGWVHQQVLKTVKTTAGFPHPHDLIDATWACLRDRAEKRGRHALIQGMGLENSFQLTADVHHTINVVVQAVVAGVFGEIPLTQAEKDAKFDAFKVFLDETPKFEGIWSKADVQKSTVVTQQLVEEAIKKIEKSWPPNPVYGPVVMGKNAGKKPPIKVGKSGLPAAQDKAKAEEAALGQLLAKVEQKSDELLGIKQKAKYEELAGIDPEEI